jgi:hypothetical protein
MAEASERVPVALLGAETPLGSRVRDRLAADPRWVLVEQGDRVLDLRGGAPCPLPGSDAMPACALVELGRWNLSGARHLALPSAPCVAVLLAAQPLLAQGLLEPDHAVVVVGREVPGARLGSSVPDELEAWLCALKLHESPRIALSMIEAPIGSGVLALISGQVAVADAGDPRVVRAALLAQPDEPGRVICEAPDTARVIGSTSAEVAASCELRVERITASCALDARAFLVEAAIRALEASVEPAPQRHSVDAGPLLK